MSEDIAIEPPKRVYLDGGALDFTTVDAYLRRAIAYVLRTAAKSSLPDSWRTLSAEKLTDEIVIHVLAGLHPVLFDHAVESGLRVARETLAQRADDASSLLAMTKCCAQGCPNTAALQPGSSYLCPDHGDGGCSDTTIKGDHS